MNTPDTPTGNPDTAADSTSTATAADSQAAPPTAAPASAADTTDAAVPDIAQLQTQIAELQDQCLRAQAEAQNARRRAEEEVQKARKFGIESFAEHLLPVLDSLEAGLALPDATAEQLREGSEMTLRQLLTALERNKVVPIAPAQGDRFDPHLHQAISVVPAPEGTTLPGNSIVGVLQKGYVIADRVLRPALVTVTAAG